MATKVTDENTITTQEGTKLIVKPLTIRSLRKFMEVIDEMNEIQEEQGRELRSFQRQVEKFNKRLEEWLADDTGELEEPEEPTPPKQDEFATIEVMIKASKIALEKHNPEFVADEDKLEDELDISTLREIIERSGGIKLGGDEDPNPVTPAKGA